MKIIYCQDVVNPGNPDAQYIDEVAAASRHNLPFEVVNYEALRDNNPARAVRDIPASTEIEPAIYRGWSLTAASYTGLYDALYSRGIKLINSPDAFRHTHHLPEYLDLIKAHTPRTVWTHTTGDISTDSLMNLLLPFAGQPVILKDFVRTCKHYWMEACYISSSSDDVAVEATVRNFLDLQGTDLVGGLVFREFLDFEPLIPDQSRDQMPLIQEFRIFFLDGKPIETVRYWNIADYDDSMLPPDDLFLDVAQSVRSRFFTMDVAKRADEDTWHILELDDAQIAPLPANASEDLLYAAFAAAPAE